MKTLREQHVLHRCTPTRYRRLIESYGLLISSAYVITKTSVCSIFLIDLFKVLASNCYLLQILEEKVELIRNQSF